MIIIKDKTVSQKIYVPKSQYEHLQQIYKFHMIGLMDNQEYTFILSDEKNYGDFYVFTVNFMDLPNQEYKYTVNPIKDVYNYITKEYEQVEYCDVGKGLLRIGNLEYKTKEYEPSTANIFYEEDDKNIIYYE